jgi:tetratricopeptide (TPR) repeat protein
MMRARTGGAVGAIGVIALALSVCPLAAGGRTPGRDQSTDLIVGRYSDLVYQFRTGSPSAAARALARWPDDDVRRALEVVARDLTLPVGLDALAHQATPDTRRQVAEDEARYGGPASKLRYLKGAIGLHTVTAAASWIEGQNTLVVAHTDFVRVRLLGLAFDRDAAYAASWCRVEGALLTGSVYFGPALKHYDICLKHAPRDPWLLLGRGSTLESAGTVIAGLPPGTMLADWSGPTRPGVLAKAAADDYARALAQTADLDEARIRLARLQLDRGDLDTAARNLTQALANHPPPVLAYWAHLFLGTDDERAGRFDAAVDHYRTDLALYPRGQTAAVALSHVLAEKLGDRPGGLAVLRAHIAPDAVGRVDDDPWQLYPGGQVWCASGWLDDLERRSRD